MCSHLPTKFMTTSVQVVINLHPSRKHIGYSAAIIYYILLTVQLYSSDKLPVKPNVCYDQICKPLQHSAIE